jgi:WD40 repeat protein
LQLGRQALVLQGHHDSVLAVSFSADGERLTSVSQDGILRRWDAGTGLPVQEWVGHPGLVCSLCFSPDEQLLASSTDDGKVQIWEVPTGRPVGGIRVWDWASSSDKSLFNNMQDGGHETGRVRKVFFSPDGRRLATVCENKLELWDARTREKLLTIAVDKKQCRRINDACFSPDGTRLAGVICRAERDSGHAIFLWDAVKGKTLQKFGEEAKENGKMVLFSPDGEQIITSPGPGDWMVYRDPPVSFWDTRTGKMVRRNKLKPGPKSSLCLSPDGKHLAGDRPNRNPQEDVGIWKADTGELEHSLVGHKDYVWSVRYAPDGKWLASCDRSGQTRMWDPVTGKPLPLPISLPPCNGRGLAISPSGRWLAFGGKIPGSLTLVDIRQAGEEKRHRVERSRPDLAWHDKEARAAAESHLWSGALFNLEHVLRSRPNDTDARFRRGMVLAELDRWDEAARDFRHVVQKTPDRTEAWRALALAQRAAGQADASRQTCRRLLAREHRKELFAVARCAVVLADGVNDAKRLKPFLSLDDAVTRGAVLFRSGRHDEAVQALQNTDDEVGLLFLALAEYGRGKRAQAQQALDKVRRSLIRSSAADPMLTHRGMDWQKRLEVELLSGELQALVGR